MQNTLNHDFQRCLINLQDHGMIAHPRGTTTREILNYNITLTDPRDRVITYAARKTNNRYLLGEFIWYMSGDADPRGILPYAKFWDGIRNSGDNVMYKAGTVNSNYGTRLFGHCTLPAFVENGAMINQWNRTIDLLKKDKDSRQAVMNIHVPSDRHAGNKDVACTLTLQFFIRENALHLIVNMRSNDVILGFTNDVFQFTLLQEALAVQLQETYPDLTLGHYYHNAGSMHIYDRHFAMSDAIVLEPVPNPRPMIQMDSFSDEVLTGLAGVEAAWQHAQTPANFDFTEVGSWRLLTPYWQKMVTWAFNGDDASGIFA